VNDILSENDLERYSRNFLISGWGSRVQLGLKESVVVFEVLDEICARYLLAAGIGAIGFNCSDMGLVAKLKDFNSSAQISATSDLDLSKFPINRRILICTQIIALDKGIMSDFEVLVLNDNRKVWSEVADETAEFFELGEDHECSKTSLGIHRSLLAIKHLLSTSHQL
jgi:hypothetical protein